MVMLAVSVV